MDESGPSGRDLFYVDPNKIDRGLQAHHKTQNAVSKWLRGRGIKPLTPKGSIAFDIAWEWRGTFDVAEVKSLAAENQTSQLRLGLGQVLDYRDELVRAGRNVQAVLVVERPLSETRWIDLCAGVGVVLTWPDNLASALP